MTTEDGIGKKLRSARKARQSAKLASDISESVALKQKAEKLEADATKGAIAPEDDPLLGV